MVHGTRGNANRAHFPITCLPKCHAGDEMRTQNKWRVCVVQTCARLVRLAGHLRVKSVSTSLMWVGAAEHVAGEKKKQTRQDLAEICNHGNFGRRPWISSPPGGGRQSPLLQSGGLTLGLERCDVSWMAGSMFDLCLRAVAKPDTFTQPV